MNDQELKDELPSYADMVDMLEILKNRVPGSQAYIVENIEALLKQCALLITCETIGEEERAIDEINNILR